MKNLFPPVLFCFISSLTFAQANSDSLAYQLQRKKINAMLEQRTQKFGQYDESLSKHTGIFGWQTKKDIRRSNDILMDIVKTDDSIYKELRILLDFRAFQQTQVQSQSKEAVESNIGFMTTINKLRSQLDLLRADAAKNELQQEKTHRLYIIVFILMLASILFLFAIKRKRPV